MTQRISSLYVHIPFCDGKCGYCAFYSIPYDERLVDRTLAALEKEWRFQSAAYPGAIRPMETIYIGGGTPSVLSVRQWERLCAFIRKSVSVRADGTAEWTVEMNPGSVIQPSQPGALLRRSRPADRLLVLIRAGVNRISLGAQSFDDAVLRFLGRRHSVADILRSVERVRQAGVANFGLDLMAGVPGFSESVWEDTLRQAVALAPAHLSVYALTNEEGTRLSRAVGRGDTVLLTDEAQLAALDRAETVLTQAGYHRYEISNYAKPGFECRHHCACWRGEGYIGLGPAAASHVGLERWTNRPDLTRYLDALERDQSPPCERDPLTPELKTLERIVFGLRMAEGVSAETAVDSAPVLRRLQKEGLVALRRRRWVLTPRGRHLADYVAVELMGA